MIDNALTDILAAHRYVSDLVSIEGDCTCGWVDSDGRAVVTHTAHVVEVMAATNLVAVELPEPDEDDTVRPYWSVTDIDGPQVVAVADSGGSVQEDWVSIQFTARYRTVDAQTAPCWNERRQRRRGMRARWRGTP